MIERDWHGTTRGYLHGDVCAPTLRELVRDPLVLDRDGVLAAWGERDDPFATVVAGVRQLPVPAKHERAWTPAWMPEWRDTFERAVADLARSAKDPMLALGGGVDGAAVLVAWRACGIAMPTVCTRATGLADYDELDEARRICSQLDVPCETVAITPRALVELAPEAAVAAETPLYNLHPVHRLALAREARRRGAATLVTGDGADGLFRRVPDLDYVPIVAALTRVAGLELVSPFFELTVIDATPRDPDKGPLRAYLRATGFGWLADLPKRSRLVPVLGLDLGLGLEPIFDRDRIAELGRRIALDPWSGDSLERRRVGWATLDHLVRYLERR